ncbi:MAG: TolC family protein [Campylobacterota bacterium]|nr:TolC family protein [Campylobacterota bacterium]
MKTLLFLLLFTITLLQAYDLKSLIEAGQQNELVQAYVNRHHASQKEYDATKSSYYPRIDLGASASKVNEKNPFEPGEVYAAFAKANFVILDGFRRENILDEKAALTKSSEFDLSGFKKALSLQITELYFGLQNVKADINALEQKKKQLAEQLSRLEKFYSVGIATEDDVERIKAALANSDYEIVSLRYQEDTLVSKLSLLTGLQIDELKPGSIKEPSNEQVNEMDSIRARSLQSDAMKYKAEQIDAAYYPSIILEDTYGFYEYGDDDLPPSVGIRADEQNKIMLMLSMNLVDFSAASEQKQVVLLHQKALENQLTYDRKSAAADLALAIQGIRRAKSLIEAAKLSKSASDKTFDVVEKKYKARVVDYVKYLDALFQKTQAHSQYNRAVNTLDIAYANYYYYAGYDPKEFVK